MRSDPVQGGKHIVACRYAAPGSNYGRPKEQHLFEIPQEIEFSASCGVRWEGSATTPGQRWKFLGAGSFNLAYHLGDQVLKLPIRGADTDPTDEPERIAEIWKQVNPGLPEIKMVRDASGSIIGSIFPYVEASDEPLTPNEIAEAVINIYNNTGLIVVDAYVPGNFVKRKSDGKVVCVDVGLALQTFSDAPDEQRELASASYWTQSQEVKYAEIFGESIQEAFGRPKTSSPVTLAIQACLYAKRHGVTKLPDDVAWDDTFITFANQYAEDPMVASDDCLGARDIALNDRAKRRLALREFAKNTDDKVLVDWSTKSGQLSLSSSLDSDQRKKTFCHLIHAGESEQSTLQMLEGKSDEQLEMLSSLYKALLKGDKSSLTDENISLINEIVAHSDSADIAEQVMHLVLDNQEKLVGAYLQNTHLPLARKHQFVTAIRVMQRTIEKVASSEWNNYEYIAYICQLKPVARAAVAIESIDRGIMHATKYVARNDFEVVKNNQAYYEFVAKYRSEMEACARRNPRFMTGTEPKRVLYKNIFNELRDVASSELKIHFIMKYYDKGIGTSSTFHLTDDAIEYQDQVYEALMKLFPKGNPVNIYRAVSQKKFTISKQDLLTLLQNLGESNCPDMENSSAVIDYLIEEVSSSAGALENQTLFQQLCRYPHLTDEQIGRLIPLVNKNSPETARSFYDLLQHSSAYEEESGQPQFAQFVSKAIDDNKFAGQLTRHIVPVNHVGMRVYDRENYWIPHAKNNELSYSPPASFNEQHRLLSPVNFMSKIQQSQRDTRAPEPPKLASRSSDLTENKPILATGSTPLAEPSNVAAVRMRLLDYAKSRFDMRNEQVLLKQAVKDRNPTITRLKLKLVNDLLTTLAEKPNMRNDELVGVLEAATKTHNEQVNFIYRGAYSSCLSDCMNIARKETVVPISAPTM